MHGFVVHGVDPHHAHHQTDPGDDPAPPPIDGLPEHDEADVQRRRSRSTSASHADSAALGEVHSRAPLADLRRHGEPWKRAVFGDGWCQFGGHRFQICDPESKARSAPGRHATKSLPVTSTRNMASASLAPFRSRNFTVDVVWCVVVEHRHMDGDGRAQLLRRAHDWQGVVVGTRRRRRVPAERRARSRSVRRWQIDGAGVAC